MAPKASDITTSKHLKSCQFGGINKQSLACLWESFLDITLAIYVRTHVLRTAVPAIPSYKIIGNPRFSSVPIKRNNLIQWLS